MILWLIGKLGSAGSSVVAAATVSTLMTAATAVPLGVAAANAEPTLTDAIAADDARFPAPLQLDDSELAIATPDSSLPRTPQPTAVQADHGNVEGEEEAGDGEEFALVLPTPTPVAAATPATVETVQPSPTAPPTARPVTPTRPPAPTAEVPTTAPTAGPEQAAEPSATPSTQRQATPRPTTLPATPSRPPAPTPTELTRPTPSPTAEAEGSADVYAYVSSRGPFTAGEEGRVVVKAVNNGPDDTSNVVMTVSVDGGSIAGATADGGWSCRGGGASRTCVASTLGASRASAVTLSIDPSSRSAVTVSVSVSHRLLDSAPANNTTTSVFAIERPADDDDDDDDDPG